MKCFFHFLAALPFLTVATVFTILGGLFVNSSELFLWLAKLVGEHDHHRA